MPSVSLRGSTKDKFQEKCKKEGISMSKQLEMLLTETMGSVRQDGDGIRVRNKK